jgi:DNA primase
MDVIASHLAGVKNAVAASGTSLTNDQIQLIKRYTSNVAMCFDADAAGIKAAERGIEMLWQEEMNIKIILLPENIKDPDELIQKNPRIWQEVINKNINFLDYIFLQALKNKNIDNLEHKREIAKKILPWVAKLQDLISKNYYLKLLAEKIKIDEITLQQALEKYKQFKKAPASKAEPKMQIPKHELMSERFLALLIYNQSLIKKSIDLVEPDFLANKFQEFYKSIIIYYNKDKNETLRDFLKQAGQGQPVQFFDVLEMLAKNEFADLSDKEVLLEHDRLAYDLKNKYKSEQRADLQEKIKSAEEQGNLEQVKSLMERFIKL